MDQIWKEARQTYLLNFLFGLTMSLSLASLINEIFGWEQDVSSVYVGVIIVHVALGNYIKKALKRSISKKELFNLYIFLLPFTVFIMGTSTVLSLKSWQARLAHPIGLVTVLFIVDSIFLNISRNKKDSKEIASSEIE